MMEYNLVIQIIFQNESIEGGFVKPKILKENRSEI